jgi:dihydroorotate dehydrogenase
MIRMVYRLLRALLFKLEPEQAHHLALGSLKFAVRGPVAQFLRKRVAAAPCRVMGIDFPNPVGLAAGLDKNGDYLDALGGLGFGFIEIGTVTPRPQPGNPHPRLFRIPQREALINRLGFNNLGVQHLLAQVRAARYGGVLGINIGKNFDTPIARAPDDYLTCLRQVYPVAHYVAVNISSPNTPELRSLQHGAALDELLSGLKAEQAALAERYDRWVPLAVKIAPDLTREQVQEVAAAVGRHAIEAIIATNTTRAREGVAGLPCAAEQGGLSGRPLMDKATAIVAQLAEALEGRTPIIAAGGIMSGADARKKIAAGASLVQIYTGFIYHGPRLIREVAAQLSSISTRR